MQRARFFYLLFALALTPIPVRADCPPVQTLAWGSTGGGPGQFEGPYGIRCDPASNVYVADIRNDRVQKFNPNGAFLASWGGTGPGSGQFDHPVTVSLDNHGFVFVVEYGNHRVQKFTNSGGFVLAWGSQGTGPGQFRFPRGVAADQMGNVYVADTENARIQKFTDAGVFVLSWNTNELPFDIVMGPAGSIWTLFHDTGRVVEYSPAGQVLSQWGNSGTECANLRFPFGLDVDGNGNVFVADSENNRIQKFTASGQLLTLWGSQGGGPGQFQFPRGVCVNAQGVIYVADTFNDRILRFQPAGGNCDPCPPPPPPPPPPQPGPRILIHLTAPAAKNPCAAGTLGDCVNSVTQGEVAGPAGPYYYAYLLAVKGSLMPDLAGVQCGIMYDGGQPGGASNGQRIDVFGWTLCASQEFATSPWPAPGGGNLITWDRVNRCQTGGTAVAGYFYAAAYSADRLEVTVRPIDQAAKVAACDGAESPVDIAGLGYAAFSPGALSPGCNPCLASCEPPIPVEPATWGAIKVLFRP